MSIIRMETEKTRALVSAIRTAGNTLRDSTSTIKTQVSTADWAGPAKDQFEDETIAAAQTMTQYMDQLEQLATALEQEITQWEDGAAVFGNGGTSSGGAANSPPSAYEKAIDMTNVTRDELFAAEEELNQAKAEYEASVKELMETEGMEDMNEITDALHEAGITNPLLVKKLAFEIYSLKRLGDVTGIPAIINAIKETTAGKDLSTVDNLDLLVLFGEKVGGKVVESAVGSIGAIWESIKETFRIGDAIGGAIVLDKKTDAYLAAIDKYLAAQKNHKASWDNMYAAAPNN